MLATLVRLRFLDYSEHTRRYRLGLKLLELGYIVSQQLDLPRVATPILRAVASDANETAHLSMRDGDEGVLIAKAETSHSLRLHTALGHRVPLHAGASMKVILAFLRDEEISDYIRRSSLLRLAPNTVQDANHLWADIRSIRKQGFAVTFSEQTPGAAGVSAPVRNHSGDVIAGLTISGPEQRFTPKVVDRFSKIVMKAAAALSVQLGCSTRIVGVESDDRPQASRRRVRKGTSEAGHKAVRAVRAGKRGEA